MNYKYQIEVSTGEEEVTVTVIANCDQDAKQIALLMVGLPESEEELNQRMIFEDVSYQILSISLLYCTIKSRESRIVMQ